MQVEKPRATEGQRLTGQDLKLVPKTFGFRKSCYLKDASSAELTIISALSCTGSYTGAPAAFDVPQPPCGQAPNFLRKIMIKT